MATSVRDTIVDYASKNEGKTFSVKSLAEQLKLNKMSASTAMYSLAQRAVLVRHKVEGTNRYEYAAGKRIAFGQKYAGRKFPFHRASAKSNGEAVPASTESGVGIIVKIDGQAHAITLAQAKAIYLELKILFG